MNIAIFGGSYDPIHKGHIRVIEEALRVLDIDKLFVIPAFLNPFKDEFLINPNERLKFVLKALSDYRKVEVCDFEIRQNRPTPSIKSVEFLIQKYNPKKIYLIIGADNLKSLNKWNSYEKLKELVEFVVATRGGYEVDESYKKLNVNVDMSSTFLRERVKKEFLPPKVASQIIKHINERIKLQLIEKITSLIDSKKGYNIEVVDMNEEYFVDKVIIATSLGDKHTLALIHYIKEIVPKKDILNIEEGEEWSILDLGNILIHLMTPEYREKYKLDEFVKSMKKR